MCFQLLVDWVILLSGASLGSLFRVIMMVVNTQLRGFPGSWVRGLPHAPPRHPSVFGEPQNVTEDIGDRVFPAAILPWGWGAKGISSGMCLSFSDIIRNGHLGPSSLVLDPQTPGCAELWGHRSPETSRKHSRQPRSHRATEAAGVRHQVGTGKVSPPSPLKTSKKNAT